MSSEPQESGHGVEQDEPTDPDRSPDSPALTIALPDGCESVSDAIVTNREMLREPQEHGLATDEEITHLSEAIESISGNVEEVSGQYEELSSQYEQSQSAVDELETVVEQQHEAIEQQRAQIERQRQQIDELQSMVTQLMDILGTEAEWETFGDE